MAKLKLNFSSARKSRDYYDDVPKNERPSIEDDSGAGMRPGPRDIVKADVNRINAKRREGVDKKAGNIAKNTVEKDPVFVKKSYLVPELSRNNKSYADETEPNSSMRGGAQYDNGGEDAPYYQADTGSESLRGNASSDDSESEYDLDKGLSDYYTKLAEKLRSYGVKSIPSFAELYKLFEGLLRPAIEAAIKARSSAGRTNMAEIDADAYARGMGGSSYISSMKKREMDNVSSDVIRLEGQYTSSMAEYLYKALSSMQQMESELERTRMTIAANRANAELEAATKLAALEYANSGKSSGSGTGKSSGKSSGKSTGKSSGKGGKGSGKSSGKGSSSDTAEEGKIPWGHTKKGSYFDGKWYEGDFSYLKKKYTYNDYAKYLNGLSDSERYLFFTSSSREWRIRRWQVQYNLAQVDYNDLYERYMPSGNPTGGSDHHSSGKGGVSWQEMLY